MVHSFEYTHKGKKYYFLWDVESGSLLDVDYVAFLCAKKRYSDLLTDKEQRDYALIPENDIKEIQSEYDEMEEDFFRFPL